MHVVAQTYCQEIWDGGGGALNVNSDEARVVKRLTSVGQLGWAGFCWVLLAWLAGGLWAAHTAPAGMSKAVGRDRWY